MSSCFRVWNLPLSYPTPWDLEFLSIDIRKSLSVNSLFSRTHFTASGVCSVSTTPPLFQASAENGVSSAPMHGGKNGKRAGGTVRAQDLSPGSRAVWGEWRRQMGGVKSHLPCHEDIVQQKNLLKKCLYSNVNL